MTVSGAAVSIPFYAQFEYCELNAPARRGWACQHLPTVRFHACSTGSARMVLHQTLRFSLHMGLLDGTGLRMVSIESRVNGIPIHYLVSNRGCLSSTKGRLDYVNQMDRYRPHGHRVTHLHPARFCRTSGHVPGGCGESHHLRCRGVLE